MLLLYLRDFTNGACSAISYNGIANHLSFSGVTATNCGIESRMCMNGGTINISPVGYKNLFNTRQMSISFWIAANTVGICMGNEDTSGLNNRGYSIFLYPSVNDLHLSWQDDSGATPCAPVIYGVIKSGDWNHICVVNNNGNVKVYVNGTKVHEETMQTWTKNWSAADSAQLVKCQSGNYIDAVRFYNHALSEEEVLNEYKHTFVNINNTKNNFSDWKFPVLNHNVSESFTGIPKEYTQVEYIESTGTQFIDTNITISKAVPSCMEYDMQVMSWNDGYSGANGYLQLQANSSYINTSSRCNVKVDYNSGKTNYYNNDNLVLTKDWSSYNGSSVKVGIFKLGDASNTWHSSTSNFSMRLYSLKIWYNNAMYRYYIPVKRNSDGKPGLYDMINKVFYVNSGTNEFIIGSNHTSSHIDGMEFNGLNAYLQIPHINNFKVDKLLTINVWAYMENWEDWMGDMRLISCTESGGWNIETNGEYIQAAINTGTYSTGFLAHAPSLSSGWHMFTMTFSYLTSQFKGYCDGELKFTITTPAAYIRYHDSNYIMIGCEATGNASPGGSYFKGMIADFKMIAGELTQQEITDLYDGKIKFLSNYTIKASNIRQNYNTVEFKNNNVINCNTFKRNCVYIRYIRDWLIGGSTVNGDVHWNGIRAYDESSTDLTANAHSYLNADPNQESTTGLLKTAYTADNWSNANCHTSAQAFQYIDLGSLKPVNRIEVHHYGEDRRIYNEHKLEISEDGINWETIHDSNIHGTYTELPVSQGVVTFYPVPKNIRFLNNGDIIATNVIF